MNQIVQTARAGPSQPTGPSLKTAGKDSRAGAMFASYLASEIKRDQERKPEEPDAADELNPPAEKTSEHPRSTAAVRDPLENLAAAIYQAPRPVEPPPATGGDNPDCQAAPADQAAKSTGPVTAACANGTAAAGAAASDQAAPAKDAQTADGKAADPAAAGSQAAAANTAASAAAPDGAQQVTAQFANLVQAAAKADIAQAAASTKTVTTAPLLTSEQPAGVNGSQPSLLDLQVPAPSAQAPQPARETATSQVAQQNASQSADKVSTPAQNQAGSQAQNQAGSNPTPDQAKAAAQAAEAAKVQGKLAAPNGASELQAALGSANLAASPLQSFEPARLAEAQAKGMIWQVCQNVENMLKSRQTSLRLTLFPEDLGRIDLRLTSSNGSLGVNMIAQQPGTGQMLESQLAQLRQALDQAGIQLSHLSVGQQRNQASSGQTNQQSRGQSGAQNQPDALLPVVEETTGRNRLDPSAGYDYLA